MSFKRWWFLICNCLNIKVFKKKEWGKNKKWNTDGMWEARLTKMERRHTMRCQICLHKTADEDRSTDFSRTFAVYGIYGSIFLQFQGKSAQNISDRFGELRVTNCTEKRILRLEKRKKGFSTQCLPLKNPWKIHNFDFRCISLNSSIRKLFTWLRITLL